MADVKFSSFEQVFTDFHPHMMFYSFNGVGKTTLAGKSGLRTLHLDCGDAGVMSLRGMKTVKIIRIKSILHYLDAIDKARRLMDQVDLVVIDTLTGLQSMAIREVKGKRNFEMNQKKWGGVSSRVIECISETRLLTKDVIYLAQEKRKGKEDTTSYAPSLTPSIREFLSGCVDWMGRLYLEDENRKLSFLISEYQEAKDRSGLFPKVITLGKPELAYLQIRKRIVDSIHG